jgi:uncharacterized oxidoreductase
MSFLNSTSTQKSTILITGGASGIGLALAVRLLALGHTVIAAGRRLDKLNEAKTANPSLKTIQGDVSSDTSRIALFNKVVKEFPEVNVLINNAGFANIAPPDYKDTTPEIWEGHKDQFNTNLIGTIHLSILFAPHLATKTNALIVNVTSIVGFAPLNVISTYAACKGKIYVRTTKNDTQLKKNTAVFIFLAGIHSFTISLRHQLKDTSVQVIEIVPPGVKTDFGQGMDLDVYADDTVEQLLRGEYCNMGLLGKFIAQLAIKLRCS